MLPLLSQYFLKLEQLSPWMSSHWKGSGTVAASFGLKVGQNVCDFQMFAFLSNLGCMAPDSESFHSTSPSNWII